MKLSLIARSFTLSAINSVLSVLQSALVKVPIFEVQTGLYTVATNGIITLTHSLGRVPSLVFARSYDTATIVYYTAADKSVWDATKIQIRSNTGATPIQYDILFIAF